MSSNRADITVYHYPNCSTCKKALRWLAERDISAELIDIVNQPPSRAVLGKALQHSALPVSKLFNVSGKSYREGNWKQRLSGISQADALAALAADGKLIKRPLVIGREFALVGFREPEWSEAFAGG